MSKGATGGAECEDKKRRQDLSMSKGATGGAKRQNLSMSKGATDGAVVEDEKGR